MYDIKWIKDNINIFDKAMEKRGIASISKSVVKLYDEYVDLIAKLQNFQNERNTLSKNIGIKKSKGEDASDEIKGVSDIKLSISTYQEQSNSLQNKIQKMLEVVPNLPSEDTPVGKNENDNIVIKEFGEIPNFNFKPSAHDVLGFNLDMMDFNKAAEMSGSRFVILKDKLALLERALSNFMLNTHTQNHNYIEVNPPTLVRDNALYGTGQLPKFDEDLFQASTGHWLIPTSEVPLTNIVANEILHKDDLPLRYTALTSCFRSEAGSAGQDTKGMIRLHEFKKVELVSIVEASESNNEHDRMLACAEDILIKLKLPYRTVILCTGDLGFSASKTY